MVLEPWAEMVGTAMGREFLATCVQIDPDIDAQRRKVFLQCASAILGDAASAEVFLLALDGLVADEPTTEVLEQRTKLLAARFAPPNHLAYFQLTTSLLDLIRKTPGARVVSTSSDMQARGRLDLEKTPTSLEGPGPWAYATSKLANILFTKELQRRLSGTTATANCFAPGMVRTQFGGFGSDQGFLLNVVYAVAKPFSISPEKGADSLIWLATSPEAASLKGEFVSKRRPMNPQKQALDAKLAADLWTLSEKLCAEVAAHAA
jgi:NAD(P)-dependent dehydrogenase (short-subunit alcohol dehydrogenase family)